MSALRPRQAVAVERSLVALAERGNTLLVAPTGAGKTHMMSAIAKALPVPGLILQHRDELVTQNARTFQRLNRGLPLDIFDGGRKRWARDGWTFGMIQSVARSLEAIPRLECVLVDEAHHVTSDSYLKVLAAARAKNPDLKVMGVTATPQRGDKRGLRAVFDNIADAITLRELIDAGHLVKPRTFVVDVGVRTALEGVRKLTTDFDMDAVAAIMDHEVIHDRVVDEWRKLAGDRRTVAFAATVEHAQHAADAWAAAGVSTAVVTGEMATAARDAILKAFDRGDIQVVVNVAVLTEGWDCQPVSCVVLLRPSSHRSTMIQMVGRGLRVLDPERYPGITKTDCIVMDFGTSVHTHGSLEADASIPDDGAMECPACHGTLPSSCLECPLCGHIFPREPIIEGAADIVCSACNHANAPTKRICEACGEPLRPPAEKEKLTEFVLTEVDLFAQSPFAWEELWKGAVFMACSFDAWAVVVCVAGVWYAVGGAKEGERPGIHLLAARQERLVALASGDDWMRENGDPGAASKTRRWLSLPPTDRQLQALHLSSMQAMGVTRYKAACLLTWRWAESAIRAKVEGAASAA